MNYHIEAIKEKRDRLMKLANKTGDPKIMVRVTELTVWSNQWLKEREKGSLKTK